MKKIYLYDPRYNLKTETTYSKLEGIFKMSKDSLMVLKSRKQKLRNKYYIVDENTTKKELKELYAKEEFKDEIWKVIEGSDDLYLVSSYGRFKRINNSRPEGKFLYPYYMKKEEETMKINSL